MKRGLVGLAGLGCLAAACQAAPSPSTLLTDVGSQSDANDILRSASCAEDTEKYDPAPLNIQLTPVELGAVADVAESLPEGVSFVGGWHLTSSNTDFGGLSGLAMQGSGDLLVVSDKGAFIEIGLRDGIPDGRGTFQAMRGETGRLITGKADGDAEGLPLNDGLAFVSFERNHRILAFNLERCGVAATGVLFAALPDRNLDSPVSANGGAESLDVNESGHLQAGYETSVRDIAPILTFDPDGISRKVPTELPVQPGFKLVGSSNGIHLTRAYDRKTGNRNDVILPEMTLRLAPPLVVDNFEGITVSDTEDGGKRIYIISDDNFSARQRTLLYAFEVAP